jgi:hypothetical protein
MGQLQVEKNAFMQQVERLCAKKAVNIYIKVSLEYQFMT